MGLRLLFRAAFSRPAYSLVVVLTIALVVGPSAAILAVADAAFVRSLPFPRSAELVQLFSLPPGMHDQDQRNPLASLDFVRVRERSTTLASIGGIWARERAIGGDGEPESVAVGLVSASFFDVIGVPPSLGRTFTDAEDRANAKVALISQGLWQRRFGADPRILGRRVTIDREDYDVIGVMPASFNPAYVTSDVWTPLGIHGGNIILPNATFIQTFARLNPGSTIAQARDDLARTMAAVSVEAPASRGGWTGDIASLRDVRFGDLRAAMWILLAAVISLGLIACGNLVNLTVAEAAMRRNELALRAALGASQRSLVQLLAFESALLAVAGAAAGLLVGAWLLPLALRLDPTSAPTFADVRVDWRAAAAAGAIALVISAIASAVPAMAATSGDIARGLTGGGNRTAGSRRARRIRSTLVGAQTALAVLLVVAGGLLLSALSSASRTPAGYDAHNVLGAQIRLPVLSYPTPESRVAFVQSMLEHVRAAPGVASASTTHNLFIPGFTFITLISIDGRPSPDGRPYTVQFRRVSPGYFATMKIPEVTGRTFDERDVVTSQHAVVVSAQFAKQYWPGEDPIGKRIIRSGDALTVIGVVGDVRDVSLSRAPAPTLYVAFAQNNVATASIGLVVRTAGAPDASARGIAAAIHAVDPAQPLSNITTVGKFLDESLGPERFRSVLLLMFATVGLLLAAVGIYGVTSRGVAERTREVGVRIALGCSPAAVRWLVLRQAMFGVALGGAAGLAAAAGVVPLLRHSLSGLQATSALAGAPALAVLAVAAVIAAGVPAMRAGRVDPLAQLRVDR